MFLPLLFFVGGFAWASFRADLILDQQLPKELEGENLHIEGHIANIPRPTERGSTFIFDVAAVEIPGDKRASFPKKILLNNYDVGFHPRTGERWRMTVRLKRPHGMHNPGGFDYERYLFRKRIRAKGYVRKGTPPERQAGESALYGIERLRQSLGQWIENRLDGHSSSGVITALANGNNRSLSDEQWRVLRTTGTNHLIAISGLHIGLVAGWVYFLAVRLWALPGVSVLRLPAPKAGAIAALLAAAGYAALAGFSIPTQRALIMLTIGLAGSFWRHRPPPSMLLALALFLVLLYDPLSVLAPGFWLSFTAVAVIVFVIQEKAVRLAAVKTFGKIQWGITLGLMPLTILWFQQASLIAPIANAIAVPVFALTVVPLTLLAVIAYFLLPAAGGFLLQLAAQFVEWVWVPLTVLTQWEYGLWLQHRPPLWTALSALVGIILLLAPRGWPGRWVGVLWLLPLFLVRPSAPAEGEVWFTLLDVGQGLSAIARTRTHTLVFDTGPRYNRRFDTGKAVVIPYLRAKGVGHIDTLIISHGDNDHLGGAQSIMQALPINRILSSVPQKIPGAVACTSTQVWRWDEVDFAILHPQRHHVRSSNNTSCVLQIRSRHGSLLLPADIEALAEQSILFRLGKTLASDILVAPHHGSKTSSTREFVRTVHPRLVLFPVGYRNRYRHPHPRVLARYVESGAQRYDSPTDGAVEIQLTDEGVHIDSYRRAYRRYWHAR